MVNPTNKLDQNIILFSGSEEKAAEGIKYFEDIKIIHGSGEKYFEDIYNIFEVKKL